MKITQITPEGTYQLEGAVLLGIMSQVVELTLTRMGASANPAPAGKWAGRHKLTTDEAAEYLRIEKSTLYIFHKRYKMQYERGRPSHYSLEELQRVERERTIRPH